MDGLLALLAEKTDWNELLHFLARCGHPELMGAFRRIDDAVPASSETGMAFFYWAAVEALAPWGRNEMLPEIAARFRRLDGASDDMDALVHVMDCLLAEGLEAETLELAEHFLPIVRAPAIRAYLDLFATHLVFTHERFVGAHTATGRSTHISNSLHGRHIAAGRLPGIRRGVDATVAGGTDPQTAPEICTSIIPTGLGHPQA